MPTNRFRKRLFDRLLRSATSAGELGLAFLMTAGVAHCGGDAQSGPGEGSGDAASDQGLSAFAAKDGAVSDAAGSDASHNPTIEAATFLDAGTDAHPSPVIEAPAPPPDAGFDAHGPVIEAATFFDAGADAHPSPGIEAPTPAPDSGTDAHHFAIEAATYWDAGSDASSFPWVEATR